MNPNTASLSEVHDSVDTTRAGSSRWRRLAAFFGPAYLISVGYMDPGNWATDLEGGAKFGYRLIWVLVMSNVMALLLQSLSARLGIVRGKDLAQCNRITYSKPVNFVLYILAELAIAACDLAEVLGMAIGLNLLLGVPLLWGVVITLLDTFLLLYLQKLGMKKMEAFIIALVAIIGVSFAIELFMAPVNVHSIISGLRPTLPGGSLYIAIGIIGATVMPHNLYLHSALVQTRKVKQDEASIKKAIRYNNWDSGIALNAALFVNAAILILAASVFHNSGHSNVVQLKDAHQLLHGLLGSKWASHLFAIALIAAGQSSTITGTLAGQIVMEGYLSLRINPWMRRMLTRLLAIVPAVIVILIAGEGAVDRMLIFSQVLLSMQLAFAVIPLIHFVSDKATMGVFRICLAMRIFAWLVAVVIVVLNFKLLWDNVAEFLGVHPHWYWFALFVMLGAGILVLLFITTLSPLYKNDRRGAAINIHTALVLPPIEIPAIRSGFETIAMALDYSPKDEDVIRYALQLAKDGASLILIHIVESASAKRIGQEAEDYETAQDRARLEAFAEILLERGFKAKPVLGFRNRSKEIARIVQEEGAELLVLGSHGHKAVSDALYGETINTVRHLVKVPVFIAQ